MPTPSGIELLLRWVQLIISLAFPVAITIVLWLAWRDFHRWVDHQVDRGRPGDKMETEIQEFIE